MGFVINKYSHVHPVKQSHLNGCWAACLEFWMKATTGNRSITQKKLRKESDLISRYESDSTTGTVFSKKDNDYGILEETEMLWLLKQARWGMSAWQMSDITGDTIKDLLDLGPVYVGFFDTFSNGKHVNVICGYDETYEMVEAMEPRTGKFVERGWTTYTSNTAVNIIGWKA
ncbi:MAG: C39 family peptidase [Acidobacteriota bacterium]